MEKKEDSSDNAIKGAINSLNLVVDKQINELKEAVASKKKNLLTLETNHAEYMKDSEKKLKMIKKQIEKVDSLQNPKQAQQIPLLNQTIQQSIQNSTCSANLFSVDLFAKRSIPSQGSVQSVDGNNSGPGLTANNLNTATSQNLLSANLFSSTKSK